MWRQGVSSEVSLSPTDSLLLLKTSLAHICCHFWNESGADISPQSTCCRQHQNGVGFVILEITHNLRCATALILSDLRDWTQLVSTRFNITTVLLNRFLAGSSTWISYLCRRPGRFQQHTGTGPPTVRLIWQFLGAHRITVFGAPHILANSKLQNFSDCAVSLRGSRLWWSPCQQGVAASWSEVPTWSAEDHCQPNALAGEVCASSERARPALIAIATLTILFGRFLSVSSGRLPPPFGCPQRCDPQRSTPGGMVWVPGLLPAFLGAEYFCGSGQFLVRLQKGFGTVGRLSTRFLSRFPPQLRSWLLDLSAGPGVPSSGGAWRFVFVFAVQLFFVDRYGTGAAERGIARRHSEFQSSVVLDSRREGPEGTRHEPLLLPDKPFLDEVK